MKLIDYMREHKLGDAAMADRVGDVTSHAIRKLKYGERTPSLRLAARIEEATDGHVRAVDWVRDDPAPPSGSDSPDDAAMAPAAE